MSDKQRKIFARELRELVQDGLDKQLVPEEIRLIPRVQELLEILYAPDDLLAKAQRDIIRGIIQEIVNEDGTRKYVYLEQLELEFDGDEALQGEKPPIPVYADTETVLNSPWRQQEALTKGRKRLVNNLLRMSYLPGLRRARIINYINTEFQEEIDALSQQKLPMPAAEHVNLEDATKDVLDKTGEEPATAPRRAAGGDYRK